MIIEQMKGGVVIVEILGPGDGQRVGTLINGVHTVFKSGEKPTMLHGLLMAYNGKGDVLIVERYGWIRCDEIGVYHLSPAIAIPSQWQGEIKDALAPTEKKPYRDWLLDIIRAEGHCEDAKAHAWDEFGGLHGLAAWALKNGVLFEVRRGEDEDRIVYTRA